MLKKLRELIANPFEARKPVAPSPASQPATHPPSFSCPCKDCNAETDRLTRARLKAQSK